MARGSKHKLSKVAVGALTLLEVILKVKITRSERLGLDRIEDVYELLVSKLFAVQGDSTLQAEAEGEVLGAWSSVLGVDERESLLGRRLVDLVPPRCRRRIWRKARAHKILRQNLFMVRSVGTSKSWYVAAAVGILTAGVTVSAKVLERSFGDHWAFWFLMPLSMALLLPVFLKRTVPRARSRSWLYLGCVDNFVQWQTLVLAETMRKERGAGLAWTTAQLREMIQAAFALCGSYYDVKRVWLARSIEDATLIRPQGERRAMVQPRSP